MALWKETELGRNELIKPGVLRVLCRAVPEPRLRVLKLEFWGKEQIFQAKSVGEENLKHHWRIPRRSVRGVCNFLGSVSWQQKFEVMDGPVLQVHVTAQFYLESKGKYSFQAWGHANPKNRREAPRPNFGPSVYIFFLLPLSLPYVNWASQEGCLFYLWFSLQSSDLPFFFFPRLSPSLSFNHRHSWLLFPILTT